MPTLTQAGGPEMVVDSWLAVMAPRGTPPQVVQKINAAINAALADADVRQNLRTLGFEAAPGTPQALGDFIHAEARRFAALVKRTGATAD